MAAPAVLLAKLTDCALANVPPLGLMVGITTCCVMVNGALATVLFVIPALTAIAFTVAVLLTVKGVLLYNVEDVVGSAPFVV